MSKREVVEYLGKSKRTVETYISSGRLETRYFLGPNGKTAIFERADVEKFKRAMEEPWMPNIKPENLPKPGTKAFLGAKLANIEDAMTVITGQADTSRARVPALSSGDPLALMTAALARIVPPPAPVVKPWLTLSEAVDYSGLPARYLVQSAIEGSIRAVNVGTGDKAFWRFNREALAK
jgi:hypothetical protein